MLTVEILRQNAALSGLTDEQFNTIATMSQNDENTVIGTKIGALHGAYDADILKITGITKNNGEKSYDYAKRVLNNYKAQLGSVDTLKSQIETQKTEITSLKEKLASNSTDETLKQQLSDAQNRVSELQKQLKTKETEFQNSNEAHKKEVKDIQVNYAFANATSGLKFKAGISDELQKVLLNAAKTEILAKGTPDFIDNNGTKVLVYRDTNGNILNNPANSLNPYTTKELLMQTSIKDAIDTGIQQNGSGTKNITGNKNNNSPLDLSSAKTQIEADKSIESYLLSQGITRDSEQFSEQSLQLRNDNNVAQLPIR
mgnify:FL=1